MIVASLLLIAGAIALLVAGLVKGSDPYLVASIAASLLATIALVAGTRQTGAQRAAAEGRGAGDDGLEPAGGAGRADAVRAGAASTEGGQVAGLTAADDAATNELGPPVEDGPEPATAAATEKPVIPSQGGAPDFERDRAEQVLLEDDLGDEADHEPPDEPVLEEVPAGDAERVARMSDEVRIVDGRPRYHLAGCVQLLGRTTERLPVHEAVELGFTPCGLCEPASALLAEAGGR